MVPLLKPIFIEIGFIETRNSSVADVCAPFGRPNAYYKQLRAETAVAPVAGGTVSSLFSVSADPADTALTQEI